VKPCTMCLEGKVTILTTAKNKGIFIMKSTGKIAVAVAADLFFRSKIMATANQVGAEIKFAATVEELELYLKPGTAGLVMINLESKNIDPLAAIEAATSYPDVRTVAFVNHVYEELQEKARLAGCSEVLAKGLFSKGLPALLASLSSNP